MDNNISQTAQHDDFILVNVVESLVKEKTKELISTMDMCECNRCYLDACAIALNNTKPMYITTQKGKLLSTLTTINYGYQAVQMVEVLKALELVKEKPHHGR